MAQAQDVINNLSEEEPLLDTLFTIGISGKTWKAFNKIAKAKGTGVADELQKAFIKYIDENKPLIDE